MDKFIELISEKFAEKYLNENDFKIVEVKKNNGLILKGMTIKEPDSMLIPVMYLESFYELYINGESIENIAEGIWRNYQNGLVEKIDCKVLDYICDWNVIKNHIRIMTINRERNKEFLNTVPHFQIFDLACIYYIQMGEWDDMTAAIKIDNRILRNWNKIEIDLRTQAKINMQDEGYQIRCMKDIILQQVGDETIVNDLLNGEGNEMYVMSNARNVNGATGILAIEKLKEFSQNIGKGFYILPSSIHEVILIPEDETITAKELKKMVQEVNQTQVSKEEYLSDSIYYFNSEMKEVERIA